MVSPAVHTVDHQVAVEGLSTDICRGINSVFQRESDGSSTFGDKVRKNGISNIVSVFKRNESSEEDIDTFFFCKDKLH